MSYTEDTATDPALFEEQWDLEHEALSLRNQRYHDNLERRGEAETPPGRSLMRGLTPILAETIKSWTKEPGYTKTRMSNDVLAQIAGADPKELAALTLRVALQSLSDDRQFASQACLLGGLMEEHLRWSSVWKDTTRSAYLRSALKKLEHMQGEARRRVAVRKMLKAIDSDHTPWDTETRAKVGARMLWFLIDSTGAFYMATVGAGPRSRAYLRLAEELQDKLRNSHEYAADLYPTMMPMIIPPVPWTGLSEGGFLTRQIGLVKNSRLMKPGTMPEDMTEVFAGVNALQAVPWKVNPGVFALADEVWEENLMVFGLPDREVREIPPKPEDIATNLEARAEYSKHARAAHLYNSRKLSHVISTNLQINTARRFSRYDRIWFPHQLDWRGRIYPEAGHLNPQGDDLSRSLLCFADGKPLGAGGAYWLAVHIANMMGHDKLPLEERVAWTLKHRADIQQAGMFPLDSQEFIAQADKPWSFIAACMEWAGFEMMGQEYVTHLPLHVDGSCNGLQHLSAMLKDRASASLVNVTPGPKPTDVYTRVAEAVSTALESSEHEDADVTRAWLPTGVSRKLVKRPVMTVPYGVTRHGMRDQLMQDLNALFPEIKGEAALMATCLSELTWEAVADVIAAARLVMDWLQTCADIAAKAHCGLYWTTPVGFHANQFYSQADAHRVTVFIGGRRQQLKLSVGSDVISRRKQVSGIAPNVVHSYDASHLLDTVNRCVDAGITSIAAVHDSYATLGCDLDVMNRLLRESFVAHYEPEVLLDLHRQFQACVPSDVELPLPPDTRGFDIREVLDSTYFFS